MITQDRASKLSGNQSFRWLLVLLWMAVIFYFSAQPNSAEVTEEFFGDANLLVRKCAHMTEYAILFLLTHWALIGHKSPEVKLPKLLAFIVCVLYAMSDEWHQAFVPNRSSSVFDVMIDSAGAFLCALVLTYLRELKSFWSRTRH